MAKRSESSGGLAVAIIVVLLVGLALWQAAQLRDDATRTGASDSRPGMTRYRGDRGISVPSVVGRTLEGESTSLAAQAGHVVVINVWGSWCGPCRDEAPDLAAVARETEKRGVRFLGIAVRDDRTAGQKFQRRYGITYPSFDDRDAQLLAQFDGIVPIGAVPSTVVVDAEGVIRSRVIGRIDRTTLRALISDAESAT